MVRIVFSMIFLFFAKNAECGNLTCYSCDRDGTDSLCNENETCVIPSEEYKETVCLKLIVDHSHGKEKVHRSCETEKLQDDLCQIKTEMLEREHLSVISCEVCGMDLCNRGHLPNFFNYILYTIFLLMLLKYICF